MKVNIFLRIVNGRGTIKSMKSAISATSRRKTYAVGSAMCNSTPPISGEALGRRFRPIPKNCIANLRDCNIASYWWINRLCMLEEDVVWIRVLIESCQLMLARLPESQKHWMGAFPFPSRDYILMASVEVLTVTKGSFKLFANSLSEFRWCCCGLDEFGFASCAVLCSRFGQ
jgi:hypothetical protein